MTNFRSILQSYSWKYLLSMVALVLLFAIANNLRQGPEKRVSWIGGQEVLAKPAPEAIP